MFHSSLAILVAFLSVGAGETGDRPTAIVKFPDEETTVAVFWEDRQRQAGKDWCRVQYDEPWLSQPRYWKGTESDVTVVREPERPADRERRIREGWEKVGFIEVNGQRVSAAEAQLADRAREMAGLNREAAAATPLADEAPVQDSSVPLPPAPGFLKRWGAHAAVFVCAALLLAVVVRVLFVVPGK